LGLAENDLEVVRGFVRRTLRADGRTLEIGCGPGRFADLFATGDYVGVDARPDFVAYARRQRPGAFVCDDPSAIGLPDARFDQALGLDLLGAASEAVARAVVAEVKRLVTPSGRALLVERADRAARVERLAASLGRIERRDRLKSGWRDRVAILVTLAPESP
ncbi:MAG TPA: class I SAM-dependent methyltransferase, partial [Vicinamibacteria bacterium]